MSKPRLTERVLRGLTSFAGVYQADSAGAFFGFCNEEGDTADEKRIVSDADAACEWIAGMWAHRNEAKGDKP